MLEFPQLQEMYIPKQVAGMAPLMKNALLARQTILNVKLPVLRVLVEPELKMRKRVLGEWSRHAKALKKLVGKLEFGKGVGMRVAAGANVEAPVRV